MIGTLRCLHGHSENNDSIVMVFLIKKKINIVFFFFVMIKVLVMVQIFNLSSMYFRPAYQYFFIYI